MRCSVDLPQAIVDFEKDIIQFVSIVVAINGARAGSGLQVAQGFAGCNKFP